MPDFISDGLVTVISRHSVHDLINHLVEIVEARGMTVFARIDHSANAAARGLSLRPTELVIFGDAAACTDLMDDQQEIGLDLPLKVLAWEDRNGEVWMTYDDSAWLAKRHRLGTADEAVIRAMQALMAGISRAATET
jgi:uncharacterized protein (DUF302 family)